MSKPHKPRTHRTKQNPAEIPTGNNFADDTTPTLETDALSRAAKQHTPGEVEPPDRSEQLEDEPAAAGVADPAKGWSETGYSDGDGAEERPWPEYAGNDGEALAAWTDGQNVELHDAEADARQQVVDDYRKRKEAKALRASIQAAEESSIQQEKRLSDTARWHSDQSDLKDLRRVKRLVHVCKVVYGSLLVYVFLSFGNVPHSRTAMVSAAALLGLFLCFKVQAMLRRIAKRKELWRW